MSRSELRDEIEGLQCEIEGLARRIDDYLGACLRPGELSPPTLQPPMPKQALQDAALHLNSGDLFQTDPAALAPLLPYIPADATIWEPACGQGNLAKALADTDRWVYATDRFPCDGSEPHDFFSWEPPNWHVQVTNPPYSVKNEWLARSYALGKPFALLLPLTCFEGKVRQRLYARHGLQVLFLPGRVDFTTPNGKTGGSWFATAWFTWGLGLPRDLLFTGHEEAQGELFGRVE